jgi:hypothetical protein
LVEGKCFPQLLPRPLGGRVFGHIEVQNAPPVMGQYQRHVKDVETNGGNREEVDGDQLCEMVLQESSPSLRRRFTAPDHVFADTRLTDIDAEFEQFAVNTGCAPIGILAGHPADQISGLAGNGRSTRSAVPNLPRPEQPKACSMPNHDRLGLDDDQNRAPIAPEATQTDPEQAVR